MSTDSPALPGILVSTQWLADHLGASGLLVVDASVASFTQPTGPIGYLSGHEQYLLDGHVPGAVFADLIEEFSDPAGDYPFTRPDAERFAAAAGALGIGPDTAVVVYDTAVGQWAARLWWLLRAFGFDRVAVLDGGWRKWHAEERTVELGHVAPVATEFTATPRPELWADKAEVEAVLRGERAAALVCSTPLKEFTGEVVSRPRAGHIPGSSSAPAALLVDRDLNTVLGPEALRERLAPALGAPRIITYCGGGIVAAASALALTLLGERSVAIYDGSLNEWAADPHAPLATIAS
ncbi:MAG: sulfurtransferase [Leifsonia xyli]|nr:MAG: sulfurtransferase [Leifsonia xyli]